MQIVYNVTVKVDASIAADWHFWMLKEHIPMLLQTGCFEDAKLYRLLEQDDSDGPTYCAQYFCKDKNQYQKYIDQYAASMRAETQNMWGDKVIAYRSLLSLQQL